MSGGNQTFRTDKEGTLSYFIGQNSKYPTDTGFGLKSWRESKSETSSIFVENDIFEASKKSGILEIRNKKFIFIHFC